jgi:hypothetical protein
VSQGTTPGPEEDKGNPFLPLPEISRKSAPVARGLPSKRTTTHRRRRQQHWRGFSVRLYAEPGVDGIKSFRAFEGRVATLWAASSRRA